MLEPGRAAYFFFTAEDHRFLTVQTQRPTGVTTETDTTGTLFSTTGEVATDTNNGVGNNFLLRAPISPGDYIIEVKRSAYIYGRGLLAEDDLPRSSHRS